MNMQGPMPMNPAPPHGPSGQSWSQPQPNPFPWPPKPTKRRGPLAAITFLVIGAILVVTIGGAFFIYTSTKKNGEYSAVPDACVVFKDDPELQELIPDAEASGGTGAIPIGGTPLCTYQKPNTPGAPYLTIKTQGFTKSGSKSAEEVAYDELEKIYHHEEKNSTTAPGRNVNIPGYGNGAVLVQIPSVTVGGKTYYRYELNVRRSNLIITVEFSSSYPHNLSDRELSDYQTSLMRATLKAGNIIIPKVPTGESMKALNN